MTALVDSGDLTVDIRVEQVRLLFIGMRNSLYLGVALATLTTYALYSGEVAEALLLWYLAVVAGRVYCVTFARRAVKRGVTPANVVSLTRHMFLIKLFEGAAWGALPWAVMDHLSLPGQLLVMATLGGVSGNAVSLLAPVFRLYLAMALPILGILNTKLWLLQESVYRILAIGCVLYILGQMGQALIVHRASRRSIALRFENRELVERLRITSEHAEAARLRAEEANQAKSRFLAAASHDLRQPVHAQELFLEVLSRSPLDAEQRKVLGQARAAGQASAQMLNTLLDFSRIEAGVIEPQRQCFALQPLFNKLEQELAGQADAKGIIYRSRETRLAVDSDPVLLELMLRNLIVNAIRYTEQGGLLIAARQRGGHVLIEVFDTGIGIPAHQQSEVFREFHQLGNPERDRLKGLGLGLAITDGLARSLGHTLGLRSRLGRGSVFRVGVPLAAGNVRSDDRVVGRLQPDRLRGLRVMVIEDDANVRLGMARLLADWGCEVSVVESIDEALTVLEHWPVQLLISDYRLREHHTGAEAVQRVRGVLGQSIPALIVTGDTAPQRLREAHDSGIPLLHKPVSPLQLHQAMVASLETAPA